MRMKRWVSLLLTMTLLLSLCACGGKKEKTPTPATTTIKTTVATTESITTTLTALATTTTTTVATTTTTTKATTTTTKATTTTTKPTQSKPNITVRPTVKGVENILLFGLDERGLPNETKDETGKSKSFRSDAIILLTIDRRDSKNPRIKMTSLARDTLVYIDGYNSKNHKAKLNAAFQFGYSNAKNADKKGKKTELDYKHAGAQTAVTTINQNFGLNVTQYIFVSFVEFTEIIDYLGGVTVDIKSRELTEMNTHIKAANKECGMSVKTVSSAGKQTLSGGQALAYCRVRKIDSDLVRTQRQRTVLKALYDQVKSTPTEQLAGTIGKLVKSCHTNLSTDKLVELAAWAFGNKPAFSNYTLPNSNCNYWDGSHATYGWVFIYDMNYAAALLYDFMYDTAEAKKVSKPTQYYG